MQSSVEESDASESRNAAVKLQKVYRSYRTRRRLADSAVVAEQLWWQAIDYARLNHSTVSFFNFTKPETVASRWSRITLIASKVGKGVCKDENAQKLAFQHWIEAIDPRHRYGHNLKVYYEEWCRNDAGQPFFYWLDIGDGKDFDLEECPRSRLQQECIIYLGPQEREHYEYVLVDGMMVNKQTGEMLDTNDKLRGLKWIFVMSTCKKLYAGEKKKGLFHHSSFLAGGSTLAAGRLEVECGKLKSVSAYSGHYRPTEENLDTFLAFLKDNGLNLSQIQVTSYKENYETSVHKLTNLSEGKRAKSFKRTDSNNVQSSKDRVPKREILERIKSKKGTSSCQLGHQLSLKWSTGAGPRIGCVADYPTKLRTQALEFVQLSFKDLKASSSHSEPTTCSCFKITKCSYGF